MTIAEIVAAADVAWSARLVNTSGKTVAGPVPVVWTVTKDRQAVTGQVAFEIVAPTRFDRVVVAAAGTDAASFVYDGNVTLPPNMTWVDRLTWEWHRFGD